MHGYILQAVSADMQTDATHLLYDEVLRIKPSLVDGVFVALQQHHHES